MRRCLRCDASFAGGDWTCPACGVRPAEQGGTLLFAPELASGGFGDADYAFAAIVEAEARHFWFDMRRRLVLWALRRHLECARSLLEVGCGTGFVLEGVRRERPGLMLAGTDVLAESLARTAPRLPGVKLYQVDARRIPFREEFDALLALDVIEHIEEDEVALGAMLAALRPGGALVLSVPQHPWLWTEIDAWSGHKRRYRRPELVARLRGAGFQVEMVTSFATLILPLLVLARKRRRRTFDPLAELRIDPRVNSLLRLLSTFERGLIFAGVRLPAGGSLLAVARRPPGSPVEPLSPAGISIGSDR
jgi:SAM-dependent methyltransferase